MKKKLIEIIKTLDDEDDKGILKIIHTVVKSFIKNEKNETHSD